MNDAGRVSKHARIKQEKMKLRTLTTAVLLMSSLTFSGQDTINLLTPQKASALMERPERRWGDFGLGLGLDYGGLIGAKVTFNPIPYLGIFAAGGWELVGVGWNVGVLGRIFPAGGLKHVRPYFKVMYGVNAATKVQGWGVYDEMFYGVTPGIGIETRFGKMRKSGINADLNVPLRSGAYFYQISEMEKDPNIEFKNTTLPVSISFGYHFEF